MMIDRISGLLVLCLGLSGAGCAMGGDGASSLDGPPRPLRPAGSGNEMTLGGSTGSGLTIGDLTGDWLTLSGLGLYADEASGVFGNGLAAEALTRNALITNVRANPAMVTVPLATESYADDTGHPALRYQLRHEGTREVMKYLAACALERGQSVSYTDTSTGESYTFPGIIGICPHWGEQGVVGYEAGAKCRQLVSACLLAVVNAEGRKIPVSLRGQAFPKRRPGRLTPGSAVRVMTLTEGGGAIASFAPCTADRLGAARDCGWTPEHVGSCEPGSIVYIGAGGEPLGECAEGLAPGAARSEDDTILRVCGGIRGCDASSPNYVDQREVSCSGRSAPALGFRCPLSGYFGVMSGLRASGPLRASTQAPRRSGGFSVASRPSPIGAAQQPGGAPPARPRDAVYPALEADIFRWREGAFYGDLWSQDSLHPRLTEDMNVVTEDGTFHPAPASGEVVFRHAFACTGEHWTRQVAYQNDRLCAGPNDYCAAHAVGACGESYDTLGCPPLHRCSVDDGGLVAGDGDFQQCEGDGGIWRHPITVHLYDRSDVVRNSVLFDGLPPGAQGGGQQCN